MSIKGIVRTSAVILAVYGAHQFGKLVGIGKGLIMGCRYAGESPNEAAKVVADWDELEEAWKRLKARRKKA